MNAKRLLVSFCTIAIAMFLVATVSASALADNTVIEVNDINVYSYNASVIAGESATVEIYFTALVDATDVRVKAEIEGDKADVDAVTTSFDVEAGETYQKTLKLEVPFELKDEKSDDLDLTVEIKGNHDGDNYESEYEAVLRVQRPSYNPVVKSISTSQVVTAGETFPVDFVLKNMGYNDLDDVYVKVAISELGVYKTSYLGDLVYLETCTDDCEEEDTVSARLYLSVPYEVESGVYSLEVEVTNDDVTATAVKQIAIENDFAENVIVSTTSKTVAVGEDAVYSLLIVNPTNSLKVYKVVTESSADVSSSTESAVVAVPAGSSKAVEVVANAKSEGAYNFDVNVFAGDKLTSTATLNLNAEGNEAANPIVVLTVVLAIIFLVLLVVLIVLLGKKPKKTEEFGESYY